MTWMPDPFWSLHDEELRQLWAEGVSTRNIGIKIGKTKNAVVGRAHRLELPGRPSPIVKVAPGKFEQRYVVQKKSAVEEVALGGAVDEPPALLASNPIPEPVAAPIPLPLQLAADEGEREPQGTFGSSLPMLLKAPHWEEEHEPDRCRWPLWGNNERAGRPQRFCTAVRAPGATYCAAHCCLAYRGAWAMADDVEEAA